MAAKILPFPATPTDLEMLRRGGTPPEHIAAILAARAAKAEMASLRSAIRAQKSVVSSLSR